MFRFNFFILIIGAYLDMFAAKYEFRFQDTPVSEALSLLVKKNPDAKITFIYNELDSYTTSAVISTDNLKTAVKSIVARNPVIVTEKKGRLLVEALQKGKYTYSGKILNEYNEPVVNATVLLLNPKDSVVVTYGITGKDGSFRIPCDKKPVIAKISSTGYDILILTLSETSLGNLRMNTHPIDLENVDVVANDVQLMADRTVFVPLQQQKNTAMTGLELIQQMAIPQLRFTDGTVETNSGQPVKLFIDYIAASNSDLSGMNMQDVKRVEYLESPADPRFQGEKYVVNFIMEKYIYGGFVKIMGGSNLNINLQDMQSNARFQYKKMTYDLAASGLNNIDNHYGRVTTEKFRFPQPDNRIKTLDRISKTLSSKSEERNYLASLKATYNTESITAQTVMSGGITDQPVERRDGSVSYIPEDFTDSEYNSNNTNLQKFIKFNGSYFFFLPRSVSMTFTPSVTFSHTDKKNRYHEIGFAPVTNRAKDNTSNLSGLMNFSRNFGKPGSVEAFLSATFDNYRTRYLGSANYFDHSKDYRYNAGLSYALSIENFYGRAEFAWIWDRNFFNEFKSNTSSPSVDISLSYRFSPSHRVNGGFNYSSWAPEASFKSEGLIESNHLMSYTGNPSLKPSPNYYLNLNYTWLPSTNSSLSFYGNFWKVKNRFVYEYLPDGDKMIRYIRQPMGKYHLLRYGVSGYLSLFQRRLSINFRIYDFMAHNGTPYGFNVSDLMYSLTATYWLNNFYFMGYFSSPGKYSDGFMVGDIYDSKSEYYLMAGWAGKKWNIRFVAFNFARWNWNNHTQWFTSEFYDRSFTEFNYARHARFAISATYTINYGKKQRDVEELRTRDSSSSGILRN